jgi:hypothetical protein
VARRSLIGVVCLWLLFAGATAWTSGRLSSLEARGRRGSELMYFPSGILLRPMALGHPLTLADLLWLRAIQYYGEHRLSDNRFPYAGHIFDTITALDPHFAEAYLFGGMVLVDEGRDINRGITLLRQGMAWNPERWELAFETGFAYYLAARDNRQAARFFTQAARMDGAPEYVVRFAAYVRGRAGDQQRALELWDRLRTESRSATIRALAERKAAEIRRAMAGAKLPKPTAGSPAD